MLLRLVISILGLGLVLEGQETFHITGRVVDEVTGAGIPRAVVAVTGWTRHANTGGASREVNRWVKTDEAGGFRMEQLEPAEYGLVAMKPQYTPNPDLPAAPVVVGPSREDVVVRLTPLSVLQGTVTDGEGQPMQGVVVRVYREQIRSGRKKLWAHDTMTTDDRGRYRAWNLSSGKLYVRAVGRSGGTMVHSSERVPSYPSRETFAPVYGGGARQLESAQAMEIRPGQEAKADFRLTLEPAVRIAGNVTSLRPYSPADFELLQGREEIVTTRAFLNGANGAFLLTDVVPGTYRLRVTQMVDGEKLVAETTVAAGEGGATGVVMRAFPTATLKVKQEGAPMASVAGRSRQIPACGVQLLPLTGPPQEISMVLDEVRGIYPGEYEVSVQCNNGYITALTLGTTDIRHSRRITVAAGAPLPELTIQTAPGGAIAAGGVPIPYAQAGRLLVVPEFTSVEGPQLHGLQAQNLAPGEYTVYRLRNEQFAYLEPGALQGLSHGVRVRVTAGETTEIKRPEFAQ